jgi:hypothetical protein
VHIRADTRKRLAEANQVDVFVRAMAFTRRERVKRLEESCFAVAIFADEHI